MKNSGSSYFWRFQSTLPSQGATPGYSKVFPTTEFQSTLPSQGATRLIDGSKSHEEFQSTLPSQGATVLIIVNFDKI